MVGCSALNGLRLTFPGLLIRACAVFGVKCKQERFLSYRLMRVRSRRFQMVGGVVGVVFLIWLVLALNCPNAGIGITRRAWQQRRLKNRRALPQAADFDPRVTLDALLQRGNDRDRWSTDRAARIQGL